MTRVPHALRPVLSPRSRSDIREALLWSERRFGKAAARRYESLLQQAILDLATDAGRQGVIQRAKLPPDVFLYHLLWSRERVTSEQVKQPRHIIAFRVVGAELQVIRLLHERRDLEAHLSR